MRTIPALCAIAVAITALAPPAIAQMPPADPADVGTIEGIVNAYYDVINGPPGAPRQWRRDSTLYMAAATFVAMSERDGKPVARMMTPEEFRRSTNAEFVKDGFFEIEIGHRIERFGDVAQVRSVYETRHVADGPLLGRGVNYLMLYWDGVRWWITGAVWDDERPGTKLPAGCVLVASRLTVCDAIELGAASVDHLEATGPEGVERLARSDVTGVLLPTAALTLKRPMPPGRALVDAGAAVALATDFNPGSSYCESLPIQMSLACTQMGLSPAEALSACTINAAHVLGRANRIGRARPGYAADLVILEAPDWRHLAYHLGLPPIKHVIVDGVWALGETDDPYS